MESTELGPLEGVAGFKLVGVRVARRIGVLSGGGGL